jgi:hypothetical protein
MTVDRPIEFIPFEFKKAFESFLDMERAQSAMSNFICLFPRQMGKSWLMQRIEEEREAEDARISAELKKFYEG